MFTEMNLWHYAQVIWRYLWLILSIMGICTGVTFFINNKIPPTYEANALIQVHDTQANNNNVFTDQALAQSYALLVNSPEVLQAVAQHIPRMTPQQLASQVSDSPLDNTQILQVRATANTANQAATIANTVAQVFITQQTDAATTQLRHTATALGQNLLKAKQTLFNDQAQLAELQIRQAPQDRIAHQNDITNNDQTIYNALQANYNQVQQQILQVPNTLTIAQQATPPTTSDAHTLLNTLVAAALSLLVTLIFILLRDWLDTTIKTPNDVEKLASLHALGSIPLRKKSLEEKEHETSANAPLIQDATIMPAFVGITAYFSTYAKGKQTFVVTSLHKRAGTSTVAGNLAISLAQSGVRVLLIDAHLHNPSLHPFFHSSATQAQGLTTMLIDHNWQQMANANQVYNWLSQWQTRIPNLWFLPSGPPVSQKDTTLLSPVLPMLLQNVLNPLPATDNAIMSSFIDIIIFDTPPLEETTDTLAVAACVDASLLVIKAGKEQAQMVQKAREMLTRLKAPVLGVIVTHQTAKHHSYFYANCPGVATAIAANDEIEQQAPQPPRLTPASPSPQVLQVPSSPQSSQIPPSPQSPTSHTTPQVEPVPLANGFSTCTEKPLGQSLPAVTPIHNNASSGWSQFLNNSQGANDADVCKGKK